MNRPIQIKENELAVALEILRLQGAINLRGNDPEIVAEAVFDTVEYRRRKKVGLTT